MIRRLHQEKIFRNFFLFPGRPGGFILPHPVDRKQTFLFSVASLGAQVPKYVHRQPNCAHRGKGAPSILNTVY